MLQIITDSAADFEPAELEKKKITCIPLSVSFGSNMYQENINLSKNFFYKLLQTEKSFPHTSQASPYLYEQLMEQAKAAGDEVLIITLSSEISGTYQNAVMTKEMVQFPGCYVVDSRSATGGQRILVERAAQLRDQGVSAKEIVEELERIRSRITLFSCMDTLEYLYKGGRIGKTSYTVGSLANIKPILWLTGEGTVKVPAKVMGMRRGMQWLIDKIAAIPYDEKYPFYLMYTSDKSVAQRLSDVLKAKIPSLPEFPIIQVGAAIGSHIGPGACGFVYIAKQV